MINNDNKIINLIKAIINKTEPPVFEAYISPTRYGVSGKDPDGEEGIWSGRLELWREQAQKEILLESENFLNINDNKGEYAIIPKSFYSKIRGYDQTKKHDFCFIGSSYFYDWDCSEKPVRLKARAVAKEKRRWILDFIHNYFNKDSYLKFTDSGAMRYHSCLGEFDYTLKSKGFCPRENPTIRGNFDEDFYKVMCASKFCLCPGGDNCWSIRFYEALMCKTIPIIYYPNERCRTQSECLLDYKYYLVDDQPKNYNKDWADHNYNLFLKYHTYEYMDKINQ